MHVLHLVNLLAAGGAELHLLGLARALRREGIRVTVAYLMDRPRWRSRPLHGDFREAGIDVVRLGVPGDLPVRLAGRLRSRVLRDRPDILHTHLPWADLVGFAGILPGPRIARLCSVHDIYRRHSSEYLALPLLKVAWGLADRLIAISGAVRDWLVGERGIPPDRVEVVRYGIDAGRFERPSADLRAPWGLTGTATIGSLGRFEARKGHETLIRAMPLILGEVPGTCLLVAGHDPYGYGSNLRALADGLGVGNRVRILDFQDDVSSFLHALDVFAFASRSEGFGQVVIEAMAAGRPVVASRIAPLTEIVREGETGLLVERDDPAEMARAVLRYLKHPEEGRRAGALGRERVKKEFSVDSMSDRTLSLYRTVLESRSARDRRG